MTILKVELPFSKSISNRLLILQTLSGNAFSINYLSDSSDTIKLQSILNDSGQLVDAGDGGTTFRFLLPYFALRKEDVVLTGTKRMLNRPVRELVDTLRSMGAAIDYLEKDDYPPLRIHGGGLRGGSVHVDVSRSSQFASALLLIAPFIKSGIELTLNGDAVSASYIDLTLKVMEQVGFSYGRNERSITIPFQQPKYTSVKVERDWSSAAFWYLLVAVKRDVTVEFSELLFSGVQGDQQAATLFLELGVKSIAKENGVVISAVKDFTLSEKISFNLKSTPDLGPALITACFALKQPAVFNGVSHLRYKESDRLQALYTVFTAAGAKVILSDDRFELLDFPAHFIPVVVDPMDDHRIAMTFGVLGAIGFPFKIKHPEVVGKSYPKFWEQLVMHGFHVPLATANI